MTLRLGKFAVDIQKISAVKAGKELDALVAEEIFGRKAEQEIPSFSTDISAA